MSPPKTRSRAGSHSPPAGRTIPTMNSSRVAVQPMQLGRRADLEAAGDSRTGVGALGGAARSGDEGDDAAPLEGAGGEEALAVPPGALTPEQEEELDAQVAPGALGTVEPAPEDAGPEGAPAGGPPPAGPPAGPPPGAPPPALPPAAPPPGAPPPGPLPPPGGGPPGGGPPGGGPPGGGPPGPAGPPAGPPAVLVVQTLQAPAGVSAGAPMLQMAGEVDLNTGQRIHVTGVVTMPAYRIDVVTGIATKLPLPPLGGSPYAPPPPGANAIRVEGINVDPGGRRLGEIMMVHVALHAAAHGIPYVLALKVAVAPPLRAFYTRLGFQPLGDHQAANLVYAYLQAQTLQAANAAELEQLMRDMETAMDLAAQFYVPTQVLLQSASASWAASYAQLGPNWYMQN